MTQLLVATTNEGKAREIRVLLAGIPYEIITLLGWQGLAAPEETGETFAHNARQKALYYAEATGLLTVAEDSGLEIDALDGAPGTKSARFGGETATYPEKFALIYDKLQTKGAVDRTARFVCALALAKDRTVMFEARGTVEGRVATEPKGTGGFGYDPIFYYPPFECTLAQAGDRKSSVSHRGEAFRALRSFLAGGAGC